MMNGTNKAFFLDRDGTINVDYGYVGDPKKTVLLPRAADAIKALREAGYLAIVITNQSGVARGYLELKDAHAVNDRINNLLMQQDAEIDAFYICPHHWEGVRPEFAKRCDCRKPSLGLFRQAIQDFSLDSSLCAACGDNDRDIEGLEQLGLKRENLGKLYGGEYADLYNFVSYVLNR